MRNLVVALVGVAGALGCSAGREGSGEETSEDAVRAPSVEPETRSVGSGPRFVSDKEISYVTASADGRVLATAGVGPLVTLWSAEGDGLRKVRAGGGGMRLTRRPAFSPDGSLVAVGASSLKVFDVATGVERPTPPTPAKWELTNVAWSNEGLFSAFLTRNEWLIIRYDAGGEKELARWAWPRGAGMPTGAWFDGAVAHLPTSGAATIERLDLITGAKQLVALPEPLSPRLVATSAGLWAAFTGKQWALLDPATYAVKRRVALPLAPRAFAIDSAGTMLVVCFGDDTGEWIELVDLHTGKSAKRVEVPQLTGELLAPVVDITFAGDDFVVATKRTLTRFDRSGAVLVAPRLSLVPRAKRR